MKYEIMVIPVLTAFAITCAVQLIMGATAPFPCAAFVGACAGIALAGFLQK